MGQCQVELKHGNTVIDLTCQNIVCVVTLYDCIKECKSVLLNKHAMFIFVLSIIFVNPHREVSQ